MNGKVEELLDSCSGGMIVCILAIHETNGMWALYGVTIWQLPACNLNVWSFVASIPTIVFVSTHELS